MATHEPVESKVKAASAVSYLAGVAGLSVVNAVQGEPVLLSSLADWLEPFVLALLPAAGAAIAGWIAPHTPRPSGTPDQGE
ncbi:holin [Streptomyces sp. MNU103]|uniref:holin n=1 Tax=Streptomyces sp. MNU103 TaxID=2560024 RepID=UPI001E5F6FCD|nr:holin [Streptomyces sp. MNU103]